MKKKRKLIFVCSILGLSLFFNLCFAANKKWDSKGNGAIKIQEKDGIKYTIQQIPKDGKIVFRAEIKTSTKYKNISVAGATFFSDIQLQNKPISWHNCLMGSDIEDCQKEKIGLLNTFPNFEDSECPNSFFVKATLASSQLIKFTD